MFIFLEEFWIDLIWGHTQSGHPFIGRRLMGLGLITLQVIHFRDID